MLRLMLWAVGVPFLVIAVGLGWLMLLRWIFIRLGGSAFA